MTDSTAQTPAAAANASEQFRLALEAAPTGMMMVDRGGRVTYVNAQIERMFGYPREELIGAALERLVPARFCDRHPQFREAFFAAPQARGTGVGPELYALHKEGTEFPVEIGLTPLRTPDGEFVLASIIDITERKRSLEQLNERTADLTASLKERDVLLQEVHHRVKNNLQIISSLINMQARKLEAGPPREVLKECKSRVEAIALIHEKLYQSRDFGHVPFSDYIRSLANNVLHAADAAAVGISLTIDAQAISLGVDKAIPCGLILNELLTNAMKHAFPEDLGGAIVVTLKHNKPHQVQLTVSDNGVGMQERSPAGVNASIGLQLVSTLTEQLEGQMRILSTGGTSVSVEFPDGA
jgi:PAS domain S-box-containing protein